MRFYGHADMQKNQLQNASLQTLSYFPQEPVVGQIAFVNSVVYICIQNNPSPPVWVPLTREITSFVYTQVSPSDEWTITHNLNTTSVNVQVYDGSNRLILAEAVETTSQNAVTVTFNSPEVGRAVVLSGHVDGNVRPTYAYTHFQSEASATWTIPHNLGYNPIVRVFIGTSEVQPDSITHPNTNTTVITFSTPQVGYAQLI